MKFVDQRRVRFVNDDNCDVLFNLETRSVETMVKRIAGQLEADEKSRKIGSWTEHSAMIEVLKNRMSEIKVGTHYSLYWQKKLGKLTPKLTEN